MSVNNWENNPLDIDLEEYWPDAQVVWWISNAEMDEYYHWYSDEDIISMDDEDDYPDDEYSGDYWDD